MTYARLDLQRIITYLRSIGAPQGYIDNANNAIRDITEVFQNKRDLEASFDALEVKNKRLRAALREIDQSRYTKRNTINPDNAFKTAIALNEKLIAVMDIARAALAEEKNGWPAVFSPTPFPGNKCASANCTRTAAMRLDSGGIASDYCEPCARIIAALAEEKKG
jgi:hypothetical protein